MGWPVRKRSSFLKFPPCLSRACLGKKIVYILYMALKDRVHTPSSTTTAIKIQKAGLFLSARFASVCLGKMTVFIVDQPGSIFEK